MRNHLFYKPIIGISFTFLSISAFADGTPKEIWMRDLKELAPEIICKSFIEDSDLNKQMKAAKISYDKCLTLVPTSFDKCHAKYDSQIPAIITKEEAEKWGNNIGMCIGGEFTVNYLLIPQ
ncbi:MULTISPECIES: hypothetical protein [Legionella]|uniref:T2SS substrate NttA domain-containing protein n=1 Tax=Legionella maceachernii TaxID=466 RepID=A0A0W0WGH5_9GAMM|nr:hypothetical protein [Legionella maceachernii]KTD31410.1 hypothetical protein Lmac_0285 [Legionella maceachernii]SKA23228.1 hypothetical protein SAMN02745128_02702 [Legionella maceachernii]SUQ35549.1 Uncharacterised protein [Legionella maceachernii]